MKGALLLLLVICLGGSHSNDHRPPLPPVTGNEGSRSRVSTSSTLQPHDLLINEVYDDPTPSHGLPPYEYLEIAVRSPDAVSLDGVQLYNGGKIADFPAIMAAAHDYLIVCHQDHIAAFEALGTTIGLKDFPRLVNGGNDLMLLSTEGLILHRLSYDDGWYGDKSKSEGGWSLEMINANDPCALADNWLAATDLGGGTPGRSNSVSDPTRSFEPLQVSALVPQDDQRISVTFTKILSEAIPVEANLEGGTSQVLAAQVDELPGHVLQLHVDPPLLPSIPYRLHLNGLTDCSGQAYDTILPFVLPEIAQPGDLVINEILFNPEVGGSDYIEIFNPSQKTFRLQDLLLANDQTSTQQVHPVKSSHVVPPQSYIVLTEDPQYLKSRYGLVTSTWLFEAALPNWPDKFGNVTLATRTTTGTEVLDALNYEESFHSALLRVPDGVSLERIRVDGLSQDRNNWHSASAASGYGTPTGPNSQARSGLGQAEQTFTVRPTTFSPDGDGFDDFLVVSYSDLAPGTSARIQLYDATGRMVKLLANNLHLPTQGQLKWDGDTDDGRKAPIGIYTLLIELFAAEGLTSRMRETCIVAGKME